MARHKQEYDPWGSPFDLGVIDQTRAGFTGHQHDQDLGLIDMNGRVYDTVAARFATPDPIMQAPYFSQGLNRYAYVFNDPVNMTDPSGFLTTGTTGGDVATASVFAAGWGGVGYGFATASGFSFGGLGLSAPAISGASAGPGGLGAAASVAQLALAPPGAPRPGFSSTLPAPSSAPRYQGGGQSPNNAVGNAQGEPGPAVQERPPGTSLFDPERGALAQETTKPLWDPSPCPPETCSRTIYIPPPDGTIFVQMGQALEAAASAVWRWLRPPPPAAVKVGDYTLTRTVAGKLAERPYLSSPNTLREIMAAGKPIPDPGGAAGALRWDVAGAFRGSAGTWELVVDPKTKTILHWLFKSAPKVAP